MRLHKTFALLSVLAVPLLTTSPVRINAQQTELPKLSISGRPRLCQFYAEHPLTDQLIRVPARDVGNDMEAHDTATTRSPAQLYAFIEDPQEETASLLAGQ